MCIKNLIFHIFILFIPSALATEYTFKHSSGYLIKISTLEDKTLIQTIELPSPVIITILSNNPEQEKIPSEEALAFTQGLLLDIDHLSYSQGQGQGQGQIICSLLTILQPASQSQHPNAKPIAISSTSSQDSLNYARKRKKPLLCSFPDCERQFVSYYQRKKHHREHLDQKTLTAFGNNEKAFCPYCGTYSSYHLKAFMTHIATRH